MAGCQHCDHCVILAGSATLLEPGLLADLVELHLPLTGPVLCPAGLVLGSLCQLGGLVGLLLGAAGPLLGLVGLALSLLGLALCPVGFGLGLLCLVGGQD